MCCLPGSLAASLHPPVSLCRLSPEVPPLRAGCLKIVPQHKQTTLGSPDDTRAQACFQAHIARVSLASSAVVLGTFLSACSVLHSMFAYQRSQTLPYSSSRT